MSEPKQSALHHVLYVPKLACNLLSVRATAGKGNVVKFGRSRCWIRRSDGKLLGMGSQTGKLYHLHCEFISMECADMGELHYCPGVSIEHDEDHKCLWLHQKQYVLNMLQKFGLTEAKTVSTPADHSVKLEKDDGTSKGVDLINYQSMVGSLLYAAIATHPDIAHAVGVVSKFNSNPTEAHLTAVKRILRYLKGTVNLALRN